MVLNESDRTVNSGSVSLALFLCGVAVSLTIYWFTLAPDVVWGDSAKLTLFAFERTPVLTEIIPGHPLHTAVSAVMGDLLLLDNYAKEINFVSSIFGALTIGLCILTVYSITNKIFAAIVSGLALLFSHTFWSYSVVAESYTLIVLMAISALYLLVLPENGRFGWLLKCLSGFVAGLSVLANALLLFALPGLLIVSTKAGSRGFFAFVVGGGLGGLSVLIILLLTGNLESNIFGSVGAAKVFIQPGAFIKELFASIFYIAYQFPSPFILLILISFITMVRRVETIELGLWVSVLSVVVFASTYQYQRHFVFLIMAYCFLAIIGGLALSRIKIRGITNKSLVVFTVSVLPVVAYFVTPKLLDRYDVSVLAFRPLPGRDLGYFLSPWKHQTGDIGNWAIEYLNGVDDGAIVYADFTISKVLEYKIKVENRRPDVTPIAIDKWIFKTGGFEKYKAHICDSLTHGFPVYIAQDYNPYYKVKNLKDFFAIQSQDGWHKIAEKHSGACT